MLLYPKINQEDSRFGNYYQVPSEKTENKCKLGFVSVVGKNGGINSKEIAKEIFDKLKK